MKNFLFLGFAIPDKEMREVLLEDQFPSIQTHKFNWNLIKGLERCNKHEYTYISARPVSDYPIFPCKVIKGKKWNDVIEENHIEIQEIPFLNNSLLKVITRFITSLFYGIKNYHRVRNKGGVIVYSVHLPFMITGWIISKLYSIEYIGIWTDPPSISFARDKSLKSSLRKIEQKLAKKVMKNISKVIVLTQYLADDFAPGKPHLVIEGIIDSNDIVETKDRNDNKPDVFKVVYTGSLEKRYGIQSLVQGFQLLDDKNLVFEIYGRGDYVSELLTVCNEDKRIKYGGFLSNDKILDIQRNADVLINARSDENEYVKYSFPSKTLEYMISGTPVITTMLPGMPSEYREYVIVLENNKPETISKTIEKVIQLSPLEREGIGKKAKEFAESKNYRQQGIKIARFINGD